VTEITISSGRRKALAAVIRPFSWFQPTFAAIGAAIGAVGRAAVRVVAADDQRPTPIAPVIDLRTGAMDVGEVQALLEEIAAELSILSSTAMSSGDFAEITRLVEAAQAVHLALVSLREDKVAATC